MSATRNAESTATVQQDRACQYRTADVVVVAFHRCASSQRALVSIGRLGAS